ncbi:hypothetical protein ACFSC6_04335 [Rufibacter sediminis]|uniref:Uncharacterized protein n=1 Tax=Rufibacter sediminis TaxID=2762756 RepID=A0ABR6VS76_9BACT|nr:hypothetical protein [Rufibacter sediminis]MBC3540050.1 hypothetical protein [Rufibacter sediminis]
MQNIDLVENITPQSQFAEEIENGFLLPEQLIQMSYAKLEYLKAIYRKQLGFDR